MNCVIQKETYFLVKNSSSPFSDLCEKGQVIYSRLTMIKKSWRMVAHVRCAPGKL